MFKVKIRRTLSILFAEVPLYFYRLIKDDHQWQLLTNRKQKTVSSEQGNGTSILEEYTSILRAPILFPFLSKWLFSKALNQHQFVFEKDRDGSDNPTVSYIIGHRGEDKFNHLNMVLQTIAGQLKCLIECIVVEQSESPLLQGRIPKWVTYHHIQISRSDLYNRSLGFNVGAQIARGNYLVLHDNDLLVPAYYTYEHLSLFKKGYDIVNLKRFIFGLTAVDTQKVFEFDDVNTSFTPEYIMQNAKGGGSLFISREAYKRIGGFNDEFKGWGGEDNEFWQRAQILMIYPYSNLPLIHLWHKQQPDKWKGKGGGGLYTKRLSESLSHTSIYQRIRNLTSG